MFGLFQRKNKGFKLLDLSKNQEKFFEWVYECSKLLDISGDQIVTDPEWGKWYLNNATPQQAVKAYKEQHEDQDS